MKLRLSQYNLQKNVYDFSIYRRHTTIRIAKLPTFARF